MEKLRFGSDVPHRGHLACIIGYLTHSQQVFPARIALHGYVWENAFYLHGGWGRHTKLLVLCFLLSVDPRKQPSFDTSPHPCSQLGDHVMWPVDILEYQVWILTMVVPHLLCFFSLSFCFAGEPEGLPLVVTELIIYEY